MKTANIWLIFKFRLFSVVDVMFSEKFKLVTYGKYGEVKTTTHFDENEIKRVKL